MNGAPGASERLSSWDFFYALDMALACLISYAVSTYALSPFLNRPDAFLAGMWATVATVFASGWRRIWMVMRNLCQPRVVSGVPPHLAVSPRGPRRAGRRRHADHAVTGSPGRHHHDWNHDRGRHGRRGNGPSRRCVASAIVASSRYRHWDCGGRGMQVDRFVAVLSILQASRTFVQLTSTRRGLGALLNLARTPIHGRARRGRLEAP